MSQKGGRKEKRKEGREEGKLLAINKGITITWLEFCLKTKRYDMQFIYDPHCLFSLILLSLDVSRKKEYIWGFGRGEITHTTQMIEQISFEQINLGIQGLVLFFFLVLLFIPKSVQLLVP